MISVSLFLQGKGKGKLNFQIPCQSPFGLHQRSKTNVVIQLKFDKPEILIFFWGGEGLIHSCILPIQNFVVFFGGAYTHTHIKRCTQDLINDKMLAHLVQYTAYLHLTCCILDYKSDKIYCIIYTHSFIFHSSVKLRCYVVNIWFI